MNLRSLLWAALLLAPALVFPSIAGNYKVRGVNPDGTHYKGFAVIESQGPVYSIQLTFGTHIYIGTGIMKGDYLSFAYQTDDTPTEYGTELLKINDHTLKGSWAPLGSTGKGFETLKKSTQAPTPPLA